MTKVTTIDLSEHNNIIVDLNNKINESKTKLVATEATNVELNDKVKALEAEVAKGKKEIVNKKLFEDGKINAAQLVALNEGKGLLEVLSLNEKLNTKAAGTDDVITEDVNLSTEDKRVAKAMGLSEEEYVEFNK